MRHFLISCIVENRDIGTILQSCNHFPSHKMLKESVAKNRDTTPDKVIITSVFEFKNEEDFINFTNENE